jgi:hypothetical protein
LTAPKEGQPHFKAVGKTSFTWCPHHKYWGGHMAADYFKVNKKLSTTPTTKTPAQKEAILQLKATYASMMEDLGNEE